MLKDCYGVFSIEKCEDFGSLWFKLLELQIHMQKNAALDAYSNGACPVLIRCKIKKL